MTGSVGAAAGRLLDEAAGLDAALCGAADGELLAVLPGIEAVARRLNRVVVDAVASLQRRGAFAERGYRSTAGALADLLGWERGEARRCVVCAAWVLGSPEFRGARGYRGCTV